MNEDESSDIYDYIINQCDLKRHRVKVSDQVSYKLNRSTVIFTDEETIKQGIIPKTWGEETPIIIWPNLVAN
ncbi:MAG TPA: hypothetical protein VGW78_04920, partial [Candidatus Babeliales bacterium]|nr:hypothetical protein [Candidatus Babeliales bacterium]